MEDDMARFQRAQSPRSPLQENFNTPLSGDPINGTLHGVITATSKKLTDPPSTPPGVGAKLVKVSPRKSTDPKTPRKVDPNLLVDISPSPPQRYRFQEQYMTMETLQPTQPKNPSKVPMQLGPSLLD